MKTKRLEVWDCHGTTEGRKRPSCRQSWMETQLLYSLFFSLLQAPSQAALLFLACAKHSKQEEGINSCLRSLFLGGCSLKSWWVAPLIDDFISCRSLCWVLRTSLKQRRWSEKPIVSPMARFSGLLPPTGIWDLVPKYLLQCLPEKLVILPVRNPRLQRFCLSPFVNHWLSSQHTEINAYRSLEQFSVIFVHCVLKVMSTRLFVHSTNTNQALQ